MYAARMTGLRGCKVAVYVKCSDGFIVSCTPINTQIHIAPALLLNSSFLSLFPLSLLCSLPSSASSNDSHAHPPSVCHTFSPLLLPPPLPAIAPHSPTFAHFLHQASNKLQVTFKKIDLFLQSLHPSHPAPLPHLLVATCAVFCVSSLLVRALCH